MSNPLLEQHELPPFEQIKVNNIVPAMEAITAINLQTIDELLEHCDTPSWNTLCRPLETLNDKIEQAWSPVSHLNGVLQTPELRESVEKCLPLLSSYNTKIGQNTQLFSAYQDLRNSTDFESLDHAQKQLIENNLRDFRLAGIDLDEQKQQRYAELKQQLSEASNQFSNNVLDATQAWFKHVEDVADLQGMPTTAINAAEAAAKSRELSGYCLTLDAPCYIAVVSYADNPNLRKEMYLAYSTRASDQGPNAGQFNNGQLMCQITTLRAELARLLGFSSYCEYSLATKMADSTEQVLDFLQQLAARTRPVAEQELHQLQDFARDSYNTLSLEAWDISYYSEKLRKQRFDVDQEELRPYFPAETVTAGLFTVVKKLFNISIAANSSMSTWHSDVRCFDVLRDNKVLARFYLDLYARENKRGGAWMADCRVRRRLDDGTLQIPVAFLTCNFMAPVGDQPSLLSFNEVTTLFHEFGHGLHHMLSQIEYAEVSGINGVAWDAVELPSQFLENWCWQPEVIKSLSAHYKTGKPLPKDLLEKLLAAKNFQAGLQMLRQIEFALFDFKLHTLQGMNSAEEIQNLLNAVRKEVAVIIPPAENRFQYGFSHIFAGGYAAGYYSYKWAEVLSADAFSEFEKNGIFDQKTSQRFLNEILEQGGSQNAMQLFKNFMGREPSVEALLQQSGIA